MNPYRNYDFGHSPFVIFYEVARACDLHCKNCRSSAQQSPHPHELPHEQSCALIQQIASFPRPPVLIFTGGDPLKRDDICELVELAVTLGLSTAITASATPLVTRDILITLRDAGLSRFLVRLDGIDAATHDMAQGMPGAYARTREILALSHDVGLPLQVNTAVTPQNIDQIDALSETLQGLGILHWSVRYPVPDRRRLAEQRITPEQYEGSFERLYRNAQRHTYGVSTAHAPQYRRFVLTHAGKSGVSPSATPLNDGKGTLFVSHTGRIYPTGSLPIGCGQFPGDSVVDVYRKDRLFRALRNPDLLSGKCGACEFKHVCGGSRARAYAVTRDPFAAEPDCQYIPQALRSRSTSQPDSVREKRYP